MSERNLFVVNNIHKSNLNNIKNFQDELVTLAKNNNFGVHFKPSNYQDEIVKEVVLDGFYFCLSDTFDMVETEELFSIMDAYNHVKEMKFKKRSQSIVEETKFLNIKYTYLDSVVKLIEKHFENSSIDFYISDQYSTTLLDYEIVEVKENRLTEAFVESFKARRKEDYIGLKTRRYKVK